jgi:hypothetical protein
VVLFRSTLSVGLYHQLMKQVMQSKQIPSSVPYGETMRICGDRWKQLSPVEKAVRSIQMATLTSARSRLKI